MPYATRQSTINFPKKKSILKPASEKILDDVKRTPETKTFIQQSASSSARRAFHSSLSGGIVGREKEIKQLTQFLLTHLKNQTSGSIYISGLPGTGKTASVNYIIEQNELNKKYHIVKINCTAFNSSKAVFKRLCEDFKLKTVKKTEKESIAAIEKYILKKHKMILLILDEIDQLESKSQSVLYKLFEWPSWENSKFVLVGIANAMDLTDRHLPRLCVKMELKPILLHFAPYTKEEIVEILKNRLIEAGVDKIFAPGAVELISAKVAGTSGDVRRALDLGKRVIEIAEQKYQKQYCQSDLQQKTEESNSSPRKILKRKIEASPCRTPSKLESMMNELVNHVNTPRKHDVNSCGVSPVKIFKHNKTPTRVYLGEITPEKSNLTYGVLRQSPRKFKILCALSEDNMENSPSKSKLKSPMKSLKEEIKSPAKVAKEEIVLRKSPRKLQFDVDSKDVLSVVKSVFGASKNFKPSEESSFPLHQKLLICTLLLIMKKGKKKDLNIGKLHQVYSKICAKRGLTSVDKSGFLFLCRQVETTGILQIGKGPGVLAKVSLQWDESEVANSLKDLNLLSSILNDTSCLS